MFPGLHIGIDRFADSRIQWLSGAVRDAEALHALFADTLGDDGVLLSNEDATAGAIRSAFAALATTASSDDVVVITYAGHGSEDHFLIPHPATDRPAFDLARAAGKDSGTKSSRESTGLARPPSLGVARTLTSHGSYSATSVA